MEAANKARYEVVESWVWKHESGRTVSIHGALPWFTDAEKAQWTMVQTGWTVRNPFTNEVGIGRPPCASREAAELLADTLGTPSRISIGD